MLPLICIDVDGTLIGSSGSPTQAVWVAARSAIERGQHLALTTGRGPIGDSLAYARRLDPVGLHIFHAGAAIVAASTDRAEGTSLGDDLVTAATEAATLGNWTLEFYSIHSYVVSRKDDLARRHAALLGASPAQGCAADLGAEVVRAQFVVPHSEVTAVAAAMGGIGELTWATSPAMPDATFISLSAPGVTKASAIATIAERLGASLSDVMMVGDGHNDLSAISAVGHGVAMGNAVDEVTEAAKHRVGTVEEDGLVSALELSTRLGP